MTIESFSINVGDVEDYVFCPRKLYLEARVKANHPEPRRVKRGKKKHETREKWLEQKDEKRTVTIESEELGLVGEIDGIIEYERAVEVYEIKNTDRERYYENEIIQGVLYAELVKREKEKPVKLIFRSDGRDKEVEITKKIRNKALKSIEKAKRVISGKKCPK